LKAVENAYRIIRLDEMAKLMRSGSAAKLEDKALGITPQNVSDHSQMSEEMRKKVINKVTHTLDAVINPWKKTIQEVKQVFAIEDMTTARLQITYQPMDDQGQKAPSIKIQ
jgi:hypothetical protein